jgi:fructokinase
MPQPQRLAGVELGGTKAIAVLAEGREIVARRRIATTTPDETLRALSAQLLRWNCESALSSLGIASFGPLRLTHDASDYGRILATPKRSWAGAPVADALTAGLDCPWQIDTDVNAAALAEYRWGAGAGCSSVCYITVGTGVGGGIVIDGRAVHGALHPEIGHLRLRRKQGDPFIGVCPFHDDCIEGLVSGPALAARLGGDPAKVPPDDSRWGMVASDLAELVSAILLTTSAQRVLIGGGVCEGKPFLLPLVRAAAVERLSGYLPFFDGDSAAEIVRVPALGSDAGPLGAIALAHLAREAIA